MHRNMPPLNAVRTFEAVARHEHIGHAADELNVSHSAVSQQVKHLEEWFEQELFTRAKGRLTLNAAGQKLLAGYSEALDLMQDTTDLLLQENTQSHISLHCDPAFFSKVLFLAGESTAPMIDGSTLDVKTSPISQGSYPENVDFVIDRDPHPSWRNVERVHLMDIYGFPACAPSLLEHFDKPKRPLDLRKMPLLHGADRDSWNSWLVEYAGSSSAGCSNSYYDDFAMTISAAVMGRGAILADPILCHQELESGQLVPLFDGTVLEVSYYAFCPSMKYKSRNVRRAFDTIVAMLQGYRDKVLAPQFASSKR